MGRRRSRVNPFYVVLVLAGVAFCVTAFAYGLMAITDLRASRMEIAPYAGPQGTTQPRHPLFMLMDRYGVRLLLVELVVLGMASFAALATDRYWDPPAADAADASGDASRDGTDSLPSQQETNGP